MNRYPANLYSDDEVKTIISSFIRDQKSLHLASNALKDSKAVRGGAKSARELNSISVLDGSASKLEADDDLFESFSANTVVLKERQTPLMTL